MSPRTTYRAKGWAGWNDFLGLGSSPPRRRHTRSTSPPTAWTRNRKRRVVSAHDLARLLGVERRELLDVVKASGLGARSGRAGSHLSWPEIIDKLDVEAISAIRNRVEDGQLVRTSQYWVAGYPELVAQWARTERPDAVRGVVRLGADNLVEVPRRARSLLASDPARPRWNGFRVPVLPGPQGVRDQFRSERRTPASGRVAPDQE